MPDGSGSVDGMMSGQSDAPETTSPLRSTTMKSAAVLLAFLLIMFALFVLLG